MHAGSNELHGGQGKFGQRPTSNHNGLSRFEFVKKLGDGTFGSVHLYRTKATNELVAIKM